MIHFGHLVMGLSYTTFDYSNLRLSNNEITENDEIEVTIDVKNTGNRIGKEVVQLYLTDLYGSVTRPNKQLKGFEKVELNPGETKTIKFTLNKEHLTFIGLENKRIVEPGDFFITIKDLAKKFILN
jgi:beta-glucosidase